MAKKKKKLKRYKSIISPYFTAGFWRDPNSQDGDNSETDSDMGDSGGVAEGLESGDLPTTPENVVKVVKVGTYSKQKKK